MADFDEEGDPSFFGRLKAFYYKFEDRYYALLDGLHEKGVDLYKYFVEPIESKGIPSFPVACALMLLLLGGIIYGASIITAPTTGTLTVRVSGANLDNIPVTLVIDDSDFDTKQTSNGTVLFEGVPLNKNAKIRINETGFAPILREISFTGAATTISIRLSSLTTQSQDFLVTVLDASSGNPVRGALISFESLSTGTAGTVTTQPDGTGVVSLDSLDIILALNIEANGFESTQQSVQASEGRTTVQLVPATGNGDEGGDNPVRGNVVVLVTDNEGNPVSATVELMRENVSVPIAVDNVESGVARFESVAPVGTSVYAVVNPTDEEFVQAQTTASEITTEEDLQFSVQVERASASSSQVITVTVQSTSGASLSQANVFIFSTHTNHRIAGETSDENGRASFTLSSNLALEDMYVSVNAEGFLPLISSISSRATVLELTPLAAGNNVEFNAEVTDADNQPASGALVELVDGTGRLFGIYQQAGPTGSATFASVPVDVSLRVFASLDAATGQSDVFSVSFEESGEKSVSVQLSRPVGALLITAKSLIDSSPIEGAFVTAYVDSQVGFAVSNCTTASDGTCLLNNAWANRDIYLVAEGNDLEPYTSARQFISPSQTKQLSIFLLPRSFKDQTVINLVSLLDDKGREIINAPAIEKGRIYTARFAASFANGSTRQGVFLRVGEEPTTVSDPIVIKHFDYTPSAIGSPLAIHSTTNSPGSDCAVDMLNNDVNNEGKKWVEINYRGVSGVVELTARIFVKPTADPVNDKLTLHYRAFAVQNGLYARHPFDDELKLERRNQGKDECYAATIDTEFSLVEGSNVCNEEGTACIAVSFSSPQQPQPVGSPFIATINQPFNLNYEVRSFGNVEGTSAYARAVSPTGIVKFSEYSGQGTVSFDNRKTSARVLLGEASELYTGSVLGSGVMPSDYVPFTVEFGDSRGVIASHSRAFAVVQGTGALSITQLNPTEFEVGKTKDLKLTVKTSRGEPITDATISFEEENGAAFDGDVPSQIAGDGSPNNGENGQYVIKRLRTVAPGTFAVTASRDRFVSVSQTLVSKITSFFELDQPDFISLSCNSTALRVKNTLDVEVTADVFVDPACVGVSGAGIVQVASQAQGAQGTAHYRIPNFKSGRTRLLTLSPLSSQSCQIEISATDPRTSTRSSDDPVQIENTCNAFGAQGNASNADGIVYINGNVFQPPRLLVDTFSRYFYGSAVPSPQMYMDNRFPDAISYNSPPAGGYAATYNRMGLTDPVTGEPRGEFIDPRFQGATGVPREAANVPYAGQYGRAGAPDQYGGGAFFDISRANFQSTWTLAWVNQDPVPHSFICTDRSGNAVVQVNGLQPGAVHVQAINKPGLYKCELENANKGTVKIKSMCPKKGAIYYTRFITRCMARKALGDSGIFDGGKQHAAKVAASVKTRFTAFGNQFTVGQTDKPTNVRCAGSTGGAECTLTITPLVPKNGFGFAVEDRTGKPNYVIRWKDGGTIDRSCFTFEQLEKTSSYRALLDPVVSGVSALGLTSSPRFASFAIKFNEKDNCVKLRPRNGGGGKIDFEPFIWNPVASQFLPGDGYALFELQSNVNPDARYTVKLNIARNGLFDGRYLFTTVPTTVGENKLFYRTNVAGDPREPGFVVNNLLESVYLLKKQNEGTPIESKPGTIGVLDGNEPTIGSKLSSLSTLKDGFYLCAASDGCVATGATAEPLTPFTVVSKPDAVAVAAKLGDVIGNYKFETTPQDVKAEDKPFACSGVNYCTSATEAQAVDMAQKQVEEKLKEQYAYVETFDLDSTMDNTQDALAECIQSALAEIASQEAQYQMCKTLAQFCGGATYLDVEEEEIEDGESFAGGLTLDSVLGDSQQIMKDIICQETEAGQNLQALRSCLQPGNRACRDLIASRIAGNLKQAQVKSVAREIPIVDVQQPVINLVTKRIQDNPRVAEASIADKLSLGGYNIYSFTVDPAKLIGQAGEKARQEGEVLFAVRPPGYDFSAAVAGISSGLAAGAFAPFRLPEAVYDWATSTAASLDSKKIREVTLGFPYVEMQGASTRVTFDHFQPTLLTLNKYPVMRAVDNKARENTDNSSQDALSGNKCTVENRPVDPLNLFDACEEIRGDQAAYDAKSTSEKAPFSRSLVFQAVPSRASGASKPAWPLEYGSAPFEVTIPPKYVFESRGETTRGVSAPVVAGIPIIGRALYPAAANTFEKLTIPANDIKRYAVQVTNCKYTRDAQHGNAIIMDASVQDNCNSLQWPIASLFSGSSAGKLMVNSLASGTNTCDGKQACVALQLVGNHLTVATVDGIFGTPSSKIPIDISGGTVELVEIARDLVRYYSDESYVPQSLAKVLAYPANECSLSASPNAALLKCGQSALDLATPYQVAVDIKDSEFTDVAMGGSTVLKINNVDTSIKFTSPADTVTIIAYTKAKEIAPVPVQPPASTAPVFNINVDELNAYLLVTLHKGDKVQLVAGYRKEGPKITGEFKLTGKSGALNLRTGQGTTIFGEKQLFKQTDTLEAKIELISPQLLIPQSTTVNIYDPHVIQLMLSTRSTQTPGQPVAAVTIGLPRKDYMFSFNFGAEFAEKLNTLAKEALCTATEPGQILSAAKNIRIFATHYSDVPIKVTCTASSEQKFSYSFRHSIVDLLPVSTNETCPNIRQYAPIAAVKFGQAGFPGTLSNCTAEFQVLTIPPASATYAAIASPTGNNTFNFDFQKTRETARP